MNRIIRLMVLMLIFFSSTLISSAQSFSNRKQSRSLVLSAGGGSAKYFGDLANPGKLFERTRWGLETGIEYQFLGRFGAKANFSYLRLNGDDIIANDEGRESRNLSFTGNNYELSAIGSAYLFESGQRYYQRKPVNFHVFIGVGVVFYNPRTTIPDIYLDGTPIPNAGESVKLRNYKTENIKYGIATMVFPMGMGVKTVITPFLNIALDGGYRFTLTDYIDDVSTTYSDPTSFNDPLTAALSDRQHEIGLSGKDAGDVRGNPERNDGYFTISVKVEYYLSNGSAGPIPKAYNRTRRNNRPRRRR